MALLISA
jgi:hypothetical protein